MWGAEVQRLVAAAPVAPDRLPSQAQVIGAINDAARVTGVVVCAAGSAPGDLHELWGARDPAGKGHHVEYGYSCMGYEIPGGVGVKLADPGRQVFVPIGDGSYPMLPGELVTLAANAESLGARVIRTATIAGLREAVSDARAAAGPLVIYIETNRYAGVPGYDGWWDVPVAEVSDQPEVAAARATYERRRQAQRFYLESPPDE